MRNLSLILALILICSCGKDNAGKEINNHGKLSSNSNPSTEESEATNRIQQNSSEINGMISEEKSMYSKVFLKEMERIRKDYPDYSPKLLNDGKLIVQGDTSLFPTELILGKWYHFTANKNGWNPKLEVRRINYTTLEFKYTLHKNGVLEFSDQGEAEINPMFFLADEGGDDVETEDSWFAQTYYKGPENCRTEIRMGLDKDVNGKNRAMVSAYCNNKTYLGIDEDIMLRTK